MTKPGESQDPDVLFRERIPTATQLVVSIRNWDKDAVEQVFAELGPMSLAARATMTVLAAMVPDHANIKDLLAWSEPHTSHLRACTRCGAAKPRQAFTVDRQRADGLRPNCRACDLAARTRSAA